MCRRSSPIPAARVSALASRQGILRSHHPADHLRQRAGGGGLGNTALLLAYQSEALTPEGDDEDLAQGFRTNILQDFTFTSRGDSGFFVTSYRVVGATNGIGTLCRYRTNGTLRVTAPGQGLLNKTDLFNRFFFEPIANL